MTYQVGHFIDGKTSLTAFEQSHSITNPATGEIVGRVGFALPDTMEKAIIAAERAFVEWSKTSPVKRAKILFRFQALLEKNQHDLAKLVSLEHGKTLEDALGSIARGIEVVETNCGILTNLQGDYSHQVAQDVDCFSFRQPLGICAGVSPFNFPVMVPIWMMIPAIACGNCFILKPSEQDPSAPVRLMELLSEAGLPPGVVQCLHGDKNAVDYLIQHPKVQALTAVASTPVAKYIYQQATALGKRAHTFGGAKNHALVLPDADIKQTAQALVGALYGSAGERCMAISVVLAVGDDTANRLVKELIPLIEKIRVDRGDAKEVDMGPIINRTHLEKLRAYVAAGVKEGAELLVDGRSFVHPQHPNGFYLAPCLFDKVDPSMSIYQDELFGPIGCVMRVESVQAAIDVIQQNQYGNGTAIFTHNGEAARYFADSVNVGMVGINIPIPVPIANHPFGGWKQSSFGDCNMHGLESIQFYTRRKTVTSRWSVGQGSLQKFAMPTND